MNPVSATGRRLSVLHIFEIYYPDLFGGTLSVIRDVCASLKEKFAFWTTSPYLRERVADIAIEYHHGNENPALASTAQRLTYWRKSIEFFADAPLFGHGTGSIRQLFERDAVGQSGLSAEVTRNPHNQTLNVLVQWGLLGAIVLYGMWLSHLLLFRGKGLAAWIGLVVVVQNLVSSLFNSHLFDFHEGWIYVLGVGIAGGIALRGGSVEPCLSSCGRGHGAR